MEKLDRKPTSTRKIGDRGNFQHNLTEIVHISDLKQGDTALMGGDSYTVGGEDIKKGFTGWTFRGQPYPLGKILYTEKGLAERMLFKSYREGKFVGWVAQP